MSTLGHQHTVQKYFRRGAIIGTRDVMKLAVVRIVNVGITRSKANLPRSEVLVGLPDMQLVRPIEPASVPFVEDRAGDSRRRGHGGGL